MKRISDEERVVSFFTFEEDDKVRTVFNIVNGIMKRRSAPAVKPARRAARKAEAVATTEA